MKFGASSCFSNLNSLKKPNQTKQTKKTQTQTVVKKIIPEHLQSWFGDFQTSGAEIWTEKEANKTNLILDTW